MDSLSLKACCVENDNYSLKILAESITQQMQAIDRGGQKRIFVYFLSISAASICEKLKTLEENALLSLREDPGVGAISEYPADTTTGFIFWTSLHRS